MRGDVIGDMDSHLHFSALLAPPAASLEPLSASAAAAAAGCSLCARCRPEQFTSARLRLRAAATTAVDTRTTLLLLSAYTTTTTHHRDTRPPLPPCTAAATHAARCLCASSRPSFLSLLRGESPAIAYLARGHFLETPAEQRQASQELPRTAAQPRRHNTAACNPHRTTALCQACARATLSLCPPHALHHRCRSHFASSPALDRLPLFSLARVSAVDFFGLQCTFRPAR